MANISAKMVADLRSATGLGMMECKKALVEAEGDFTKAEEILRIKSGAKAGKVAGRTAAEGIITSDIEGSIGALVEVNCETDFVAKDANFTDFAREVAAVIVKDNPTDLETLKDAKTEDSRTLEEKRKEVIARLGENIHVRRFKRYETEHTLAVYMHGSKIGVMVEYEGEAAIARDVAMHIAAMKPQALCTDQVDPEVIEKEKHIYKEQAKDSGKPQEVIDKMVEGRVKKYLAETTLLGQGFVKDPKKTIEELLKEHYTRIFSFTAFHVGEGIEKKKVDYEAEVAAAAKI